MHLSTLVAWAWAGLAIPVLGLADPDTTGGDSSLIEELSGQRFMVHGQSTFVEQATDGFHAPYAGPNSLSPHSGRETFDVTLMFGARLWQGAEAWVTPEIDQGFGLNDSLGMAGFPSGEAYKVGSSNPYFRLPRLFVRQTVDVGPAEEVVPAAQDQFAGRRSADRWVFTVGKFGVTDIFDTNQYAHDPRADFLNWTAIDAGTFDYAADAWGLTVGAAAERYAGPWAVRAGVFDLSVIPNSPTLDPGLHQFQMDAELERRYELYGHGGRALLTAYDSRGRMALLDQAIALALATGTRPDPSRVRQYRSRIGVSFDLEQSVSDEAGIFARFGRAGGNVEAYEFTDVDRSASIGASLQGQHWRRPDDTVGIAFMDNAISALRQRYLALGGLGILVGDGRLPHPGAEQILESYYQAAVAGWAHVTLDYQWARNPAYNSDRGPVSILAIRLHAEF